MKVYLDVSPLQWLLWPLWGVEYEAYPSEKMTRWIGLGPFRLCLHSDAA